MPEAKVALREAATYIADRDGPDRAADWLRGMYESIDGLEVVPAAFAPLQVRAGRAIHSKLAMRSYRVYYVIDEVSSTVFLIDVVHTARETEIGKYRD